MAATPFVIHERTSFEDIERWSGDAITFILSRASSFQPLAEGVAIAKLHELARRGTILRAEYTSAVEPADLEQPSQRSIGLLNQPYGLFLLKRALSLHDATGTDVRSALHEALWREITTTRGMVGYGSKAYSISRDPDYSIPDYLLERGEQTFPGPTRFRNILTQAARAISGRDSFGYGQKEGNLITFLYETSLNSFEHAREDLDRSAIAGFRGIIVEKLIFAGLDDLRSRALPAFFASYLESVWPAGDHRLLALVFSVYDVGPGIQHTLPSRAGETYWDKVNRAFRRGETRKPRSSGKNVGAGLTNALAACADLGALLFLSSSDVLAFKSFVGVDPKNVDHVVLDSISSSYGKRVGTTVSLVWPAVLATPEQGSLIAERPKV